MVTTEPQLLKQSWACSSIWGIKTQENRKWEEDRRCVLILSSLSTGDTEVVLIVNH